MSVKVAVIGCKDTTYELLNYFKESNKNVDYLITIDPQIAGKNRVAGYQDLSGYEGELYAKIYSCTSYSLKHQTDFDTLMNLDIDVCFVIGWQRLLPSWFLEQLSIGAFGMHGSSRALPYGRGRSPMNWSLIQNKQSFITNLFKYKSGIDDGEIVGYQAFDLNPFDDAKTVHFKNTLAMISLIERFYDQIIGNSMTLNEQLDVKPTYFPKRGPEDGIIFWDKDSLEVYNLVRAVTKPFHGAFTFLHKSKITIWKLIPFDQRLFDAYTLPGTILHVFYNGEFVVKTGDGSVLVNDYEVENGIEIVKNVILNCKNYEYVNPFNYPS